jgi:bifunctional non-homologous end joining protein LigD
VAGRCEVTNLAKVLFPGTPDWLTQWRNTEADPGETRCYAVLDSVAAVVWMANFGGIELHPWTSRLPNVHQPTWALIDIDPGGTTSFDDVLSLARLFRTALEHLNVSGIPKGHRAARHPDLDPGPRRLHLHRHPAVGAHCVPRRRPHAPRPRQLAVVPRPPTRTRSPRLHQNAINKTLVAPFSVRPKPHAPVSIPITWAELDDPALRPDRWTIRTALDRLADQGDPLAELIGRQQDLSKL